MPDPALLYEVYSILTTDGRWFAEVVAWDGNGQERLLYTTALYLHRCEAVLAASLWVRASGLIDYTWGGTLHCKAAPLWTRKD